ncbi:MAG: LD-carboxypeptidase, partial [Lachnospiraceae bacterium]|nr:LD-carboxypeptidase [Lachnospiraceae bacterium]
LIGRPLCFGQEMMGLDAYEAVLAVAGKKNVPVIMDVDLGHLPPMMPVVVGSKAKVTVNDQRISVKMDLQAL